MAYILSAERDDEATGLGAYHDGHIRLEYRDVSRYRLDFHTRDALAVPGHRDWRYDEFRLAADNRVAHEIEWWGSREVGTWLIEAADVSYRWLPFAGADGAGNDG